MSRRVLFVWMLVSALAVVVPKAWAQRPPQMDPPSGVITQDVVMSWDRSAIPAGNMIVARPMSRAPSPFRRSPTTFAGSRRRC